MAKYWIQLTTPANMGDLRNFVSLPYSDDAWKVYKHLQIMGSQISDLAMVGVYPYEPECLAGICRLDAGTLSKYMRALADAGYIELIKENELFNTEVINLRNILRGSINLDRMNLEEEREERENNNININNNISSLEYLETYSNRQSKDSSSSVEDMSVQDKKVIPLTPLSGISPPSLPFCDANEVPPDRDSVNNFIQAKNLNVSADEFFDFYEATDWMMGDSKMRNWQATLITWSKKSTQRKPAKPSMNYEPITREYMEGLIDRI